MKVEHKQVVQIAAGLSARGKSARASLIARLTGREREEVATVIDELRADGLYDIDNRRPTPKALLVATHLRGLGAPRNPPSNLPPVPTKR